MRSGKFLLGTSGMLGAMTAAERAKGRYMRAPDGHDEFAEFEAAGAVEVGSEQKDLDDETGKPAEKAKKAGGSGKPPREKAAPAKPVVETNTPADDGGDGANADDGGEDDEDDEGGEGEEGDEKAAKPKQKASDRIRELNKRLRQEERLRLASDERLANLEKRLLPNSQADGNSEALGEAPDPADQTKYPLGHLDDRYIEDKLEWLATKKAAEKADAALQREQGKEQQAAQAKQHADLLEKVDTLSDRGSADYDDFQEAVVEAGMRGDWRLEQPTFEAAFDADHGHQILYELSQDKKEAARVAGLTPYQQLKYVADRDAEISKTKQPRKIPKAGEPPATQTRGANSRTRINPATDNLDDFEKAWEADAKGKR